MPRQPLGENKLTKIKALIRKCPGKAHGYYIKAYQKFYSDLEGSDIKRLLDYMVKRHIIDKRLEGSGGGMHYWNLYLPIYTLFGEELSLRQIVKHPENKQRLSWTTIYHRIVNLEMIPIDALTLPKEERTPIKRRYKLCSLKGEEWPDD